MRSISLLCALALVAGAPVVIYAQDGGVEGPKPILVAAKKAVAKKKVAKPTGPPAKVLFGAAKSPAPMAARAIGFYAKGCLAGAKALPIDGPGWQAMRLSRNRNWGHPRLVSLLERLANDARRLDGWHGCSPSARREAGKDRRQAGRASRRACSTRRPASLPGQ